MKKYAVAVDGPAGSGKSTVAKAVAKRLGIVYVDTGAMYRSVAYDCMEKGVDPNDEKGVLKRLDEIRLVIQPSSDGQRIFLNGEDITDRIRTQVIGQGASDVGKIEAVREKLGDIQRDMAKEYSVIMDGRDIGTYVLPDADVKIYLDAAVEERTKRRMGELKEKGESPVFETVLQELIKRDENDMSRKCRPLKKAEDAVYLDTTNMTAEKAVEEILNIINKKIEGGV